MANTIQKESKIIYLQIGQNYENLGVQKQFDVSEWTAEFPDAHIYLLFKRPGEEAAAPVNTTLDEDGILTWTVSNWETGIIGIGFAEIRAIDSSTGLVKKSHVIPCSIEASVTDEDAAPDYPSWVDRMLRFGENVDSIYATLPHELEEGIASIQQEAQTQTEAIEQKGITTRASIPSDYTTLSDDITSLKSAFDITKDAITIQDRTNPSYQAGYIRDNGEFGNSSNYCRTRMLMFGSGEIIITPKSGYKIKIAEYSQGNTSYYLGLVSGNTTNSVTFIAVSGHYYAIQIGSADGSSVKEENIAVDAVTISHTAYTDNTLSAPGKSADAYTVGNDLNGIKSNMGFWYQKLIVPANTSHSASDDILNVVIPSGSVYCIVCKMDGAYHPQIYAGLQDGTSERVYIDASSTYYSFSTVLTANADIKSFGIFLSGTTSPKRTIELMILTGDSASGLFHYTNKTSAYIRYPQGMLCFKTGRSRVLVQSISVWNNQVWEFDEGHAYYNGVTYALDNGHGNSCNWGTELHGDYPYLYCPTYSDGYNVKVYSFDGTGFTLERTITLSAYTTGYMTAYVDENAGYIYSFGYSDIYSGQHMFAVSDMTGTTVMTKLIPSKIPIVQGMCMHDGILYVTSGYGNAQYPNYLNKISTDGTLLGRFRMYGIGEIEGIDFLDNKMVLASYYEFYINPVLVPEVKFYGYVDQLK